MGQKILGGVATVVGVIIFAGIWLGLSGMSKANAAKEVKEKLTTICADMGEEKQGCLAAIDTHFEACFDANYSMGSRRRAGGLNGERFTTCLNDKAGKTYFAYENK